MYQQIKVTGVVLAGGLARRMDKQDKGLVVFNNKPMVSYAFKAMSQIANPVFINANRNIQTYKQFGCKVISDQTKTFDGPLAGVLSAMGHTSTELLLVMPCDSPLIKTEHLEVLLKALVDTDDKADIAVAFDGKRLQPVLLALRTSLKSSLEEYLEQGFRKIDQWLELHSVVKVDFSHHADIFLNINTLSELQALEEKTGA